MYAKIVNNQIVTPPHNDGNKINVHLDAEWLAANGYTDMIDAELAQYATVSAQSVFTKLQIRRAMRALGMESTLDTILSSDATVKADWTDAQEIDLNDTVLRSAINAAGIMDVQITEIKTKILEG